MLVKAVYSLSATGQTLSSELVTSKSCSLGSLQTAVIAMLMAYNTVSANGQVDNEIETATGGYSPNLHSCWSTFSLGPNISIASRLLVLREPFELGLKLIVCRRGCQCQVF